MSALVVRHGRDIYPADDLAAAARFAAALTAATGRDAETVPTEVLSRQAVWCARCGAVLPGLLSVCVEPGCLSADIASTVAYERGCDDL